MIKTPQAALQVSIFKEPFGSYSREMLTHENVKVSLQKRE
jgi:hypothetical protein